MKQSGIDSLANYTEVDTDQFEKQETIIEHTSENITRYEKILQAFDHFTVITNSNKKVEVKSEIFKKVIELTGRHPVELLNYITFNVIKTIETRRKKSKNSPKKKHKRKVSNKDPAYERLLNFLQVFLIKANSETISVPTFSMKRIYDMLNMELYFILSKCTITCIKYTDEEEEETREKINRLSMLNFRSMFMQKISNYEESEKIQKFNFINDYSNNFSQGNKFEDFFAPLDKVDMLKIKKLYQKKVVLKKPKPRIIIQEKYKRLLEFLKFYVIKVKSGQSHLLMSHSIEMIFKKMSREWYDLLYYLKIVTDSSEEKINIMKMTYNITKLSQRMSISADSNKIQLDSDLEISNKLQKNDLSPLIRVVSSTAELIDVKPEYVEDTIPQNFATKESLEIIDKIEDDPEPIQERNNKNIQEEADFTEKLVSEPDQDANIVENTDKVDPISDEVKAIEEYAKDISVEVKERIVEKLENNLEVTTDNISNDVQEKKIEELYQQEKEVELIKKAEKVEELIGVEYEEIKHKDEEMEKLEENWQKVKIENEELIQVEKEESIQEEKMEVIRQDEIQEVEEELKQVERFDEEQKHEEKDEIIKQEVIEIKEVKQEIKVINQEFFLEEDIIDGKGNVSKAIKYVLCDSNLENDQDKEWFNYVNRNGVKVKVRKLNANEDHYINSDNANEVVNEEKESLKEIENVDEIIEFSEIKNNTDISESYECKQEENSIMKKDEIEDGHENEINIISVLTINPTKILNEESENMEQDRKSFHEEPLKCENNFELESNKAQLDVNNDSHNDLIINDYGENNAIKEKDLENPTQDSLEPESIPIENNLVEKNDHSQQEGPNVEHCIMENPEDLIEIEVNNFIIENQDRIIKNFSDQVHADINTDQCIEQPEKPQYNLQKETNNERVDLIRSDENDENEESANAVTDKPIEESSKIIIDEVMIEETKSNYATLQVTEEYSKLIQEEIQNKEIEEIPSNELTEKSLSHTMNIIEEKDKVNEEEINEILREDTRKLSYDQELHVKNKEQIESNEDYVKEVNEEEETLLQSEYFESTQNKEVNVENQESNLSEKYGTIKDDNDIAKPDKSESSEIKDSSNEINMISEHNNQEQEINHIIASDENNNNAIEESIQIQDSNICEVKEEITNNDIIIKEEKEMVETENTNDIKQQPESQDFEERINLNEDDDNPSKKSSLEDYNTENETETPTIIHESDDIEESKVHDVISTDKNKETLSIAIKQNRIFLVKSNKAEDNKISYNLEDISYMDNENNLYQSGEKISAYEKNLPSSSDIPSIKLQSNITSIIDNLPVIMTDNEDMIKQEIIENQKDTAKPISKKTLSIDKKIFKSLRYPIELFLHKIKEKKKYLRASALGSNTDSLILTSKDFIENNSNKDINYDAHILSEDSNENELNLKISDDLIMPYYGIRNISELADPDYEACSLNDIHSKIQDIEKTFNNMVHTKYLLPENAENILKFPYTMNSFLFLGHINNINRHIVYRKKMEQNVQRKLSYREFLHMREKFSLP